MRVLMIGLDPTVATGDGSQPGDTRERHVKYAEALRRRFPGGQIEVVVKAPRSWSSRPREIAEGLRVHPVPSARAAFALRALLVSGALAGRERLDIVTTQTPFDDGVVGVWLKRRWGLALNVQMRSSFLDLSWWLRQRPIVYRGFNVAGKWVARRADTVRVVSLGEKARLERRFPHLAGKLVCLPPFVNRAMFEPPIRREELEQAQAALKQRGLGGAPFLLFVGRLVPEKNVATLLRAFALGSVRAPEAALVLAGDGPLRGELGTLARALRIETRVVWLGAVSLLSLRPWYAAAAALVLPSLQEGFGKVVVESYLMGTPVIATPFVSAAELVDEGRTGFIAPDFGDAPWLADRMVFLLRHPDEARALGQEGRTHVQSYLLSEAEYLDRLIAIWRDTAMRAQQAR